MCTLEPLGYASNQFFTIPFLVLEKVLAQQVANPSEANERMVELVAETCSNMLATNDKFKEEVVDNLIGFIENPANRTADVHADLGVLAAQAWSWNRLPAEQKDVVNNDPQAMGEPKTIDQAGFKRFTRYAVEEILRRKLKNDAGLTGTQLLSQLAPDYSAVVNNFKAETQTRIQNDMAGAAGQDEYAIYAAEAEALRQKAAGEAAGAEAAAAQEEEKKDAAGEEESKGDKPKTIDDIIEETVATSPWNAKIDNVIGQVSKFTTNRAGLIRMFTELEGRDAPYG